MADRVKAARLRAGLKKADFSRACDVSWQTVHNWETGETVPDRDNLARISEVTGFAMHELLEGHRAAEAMPAAMARALEIYARTKELTAEQLALASALSLKYRGGPPTDPAKYVALFEHILNDGGEPVRRQETEAKARDLGVQKVQRRKKGET